MKLLAIAEYEKTKWVKIVDGDKSTMPLLDELVYTNLGVLFYDERGIFCAPVEYDRWDRSREQPTHWYPTPDHGGN